MLRRRIILHLLWPAVFMAIWFLSYLSNNFYLERTFGIGDCIKGGIASGGSYISYNTMFGPPYGTPVHDPIAGFDFESLGSDSDGRAIWLVIPLWFPTLLSFFPLLRA